MRPGGIRGERDQGLAELGLPRFGLKPVKDLEVFGGNLRRVVPFEMVRDRRVGLPWEFGVGPEQAQQLRRQIDWVTPAKEGSGRADGFGKTAAVRAEDDATRGGPFQSDDTKGLLVDGGDDEDFVPAQFAGHAVRIEGS